MFVHVHVVKKHNNHYDRSTKINIHTEKQRKVGSFVISDISYN